MVNSAQLDRGIQILPGTSSTSLENTVTGIVVIGDKAGTGGTAEDDKLHKITNSGDAKQIFGDPDGEDTIAHYLQILHRYGIGSILAAKTANPANVLSKLPSAFSDFGINPDVIVIPKLGETPTPLQGALDLVDKFGGVVIGDFPKTKTVEEIVTERGTDAGMGMKHKQFIPTFGYTKSKFNTDWVEPLSIHEAGLIGLLDSTVHAGRVPSNQLLRGVDEAATTTPGGGAAGGADEEPIITVSYVDQESGSEKLNDVGVVTLNRRFDGLVSWGDRNALFPKDKGFDSLITIPRISDSVLKVAKERSQLFIDLESNRRTGKLLETSILDGLALLAAKGMIMSYKATFIEADSDYAAGRLVVCIEFVPFTNVRLIQLKPVFKFTVSVSKV